MLINHFTIEKFDWLSKKNRMTLNSYHIINITYYVTLKLYEKRKKFAMYKKIKKQALDIQ